MIHLTPNDPTTQHFRETLSHHLTTHGFHIPPHRFACGPINAPHTIAVALLDNHGGVIHDIPEPLDNALQRALYDTLGEPLPGVFETP